MVVGLKISSQTQGFIQIGTGYNNLRLLKSGTIDVNTFTSEGGVLSGYIVANSGSLPVSTDIDSIYVIRYLTTDNRFGFSIMKRRLPVSGNISNSLFIAQNAPIRSAEYYIFGNGNPAVTGAVGLRVKSESGEVSYDSRMKQLRVLQAVNLPTMSAPIISLGQFFPGKKIGLALANPRFRYDAPFQERCYMYADQISMDASNNIWMNYTEVVQRVEAGAFPLGNVTAANTNAVLLIIDLDEIPIPFN